MNSDRATLMGRPRAFDEEEVVAQAMLMFWARGFRGTTVSGLTDATGLAPQSLYGAFGDKRQLFLRALERYMAEGLAGIRETLESAQTPLAGLRCYLERQLALACGERSQRGCLMANTALELLPGEAAVTELVARNFAGLREVLSAAVERAQAAGEIDAQRPADAIAWQLLVLIEGLQVLGRTVGRSELQGVVTATFKALS